jgi:hypothetical protein
VEPEPAPLQRLEVDCTTGASTALEPQRLRLRNAVYDVALVVDRWYEGPRRAGGPVYRYYKVRTRGGSTFLIQYDESADAWFLVKAFGPEVPHPD